MPIAALKKAMWNLPSEDKHNWKKGIMTVTLSQPWAVKYVICMCKRMKINVFPPNVFPVLVLLSLPISAHHSPLWVQKY